MSRIKAAALALVFGVLVPCVPAHAGASTTAFCGDRYCNMSARRGVPWQRHRVAVHDPRPRAWCGWWMRHHLHVADRRYNRARAWTHYGRAAHGPRVGAIVVWPHHVGIITARTPRGWQVKSGNDGHRVRNRVRSLRGAIAFRLPNPRFDRSGRGQF